MQLSLYVMTVKFSLNITIDWFCVCLFVTSLTYNHMTVQLQVLYLNTTFSNWIPVIGHQCHLQVNIMCVYGFLVNVSLLFVI